ncbi:MAG: hypothetical protein PHC60_08470, partial [Heliobacteriaceae bacterium]|nr:hypothetical protein [Heliobacteriaceae bacterium]
VSPQDFTIHLQSDLESFTPGYYPALQVSTAKLAADRMAVYLTTSPQATGTRYTLRYKNNCRANFTGAGTPAKISRVEVIDGNTVKVYFDRLVAAVAPGDFSFSPSLGTVTAVLDAGYQSATLSCSSPQTVNQPYVLYYNPGGATAVFTGKGIPVNLAAVFPETRCTLRVTFGQDPGTVRATDFKVSPYLTVRNILPTSEPQTVVLVTDRQNTGPYLLTYLPGDGNPVAFNGSPVEPVWLSNLRRTPVLGRFTFNTDRPVTAAELAAAVRPVAITSGGEVPGTANITVNFTPETTMTGTAWAGEIIPAPDTTLPCKFTIAAEPPFIPPVEQTIWWEGVGIKSLLPVNPDNPDEGVRLTLETISQQTGYPPVTQTQVQAGITMAGIPLTWLQEDLAGCQFRTVIPGAVCGKTYTFDVSNHFYLTRGVEPTVQWRANANNPVGILSLEPQRNPVTGDYYLVLKTDRPVLSSSLNGLVTLPEWQNTDETDTAPPDRGPIWTPSSGPVCTHIFTVPVNSWLSAGRPYTFDLAGPFFIQDRQKLTVTWPAWP